MLLIVRNAIYQWPSDLYKPKKTCIVLLTVPEDIRRERVMQRNASQNTVWEENILQDKFRSLVLAEYSKIEGIHSVDASPPLPQVVAQVISMIKNSLEL